MHVQVGCMGKVMEAWGQFLTHGRGELADQFSPCSPWMNCQEHGLGRASEEGLTILRSQLHQLLPLSLSVTGTFVSSHIPLGSPVISAADILDTSKWTWTQADSVWPQVSYVSFCFCLRVLKSAFKATEVSSASTAESEGVLTPSGRISTDGRGNVESMPQVPILHADFERRPFVSPVSAEDPMRPSLRLPFPGVRCR